MVDHPYPPVPHVIFRTAAILGDPYISKEHVVAITDPDSTVYRGVETMISAMESKAMPLPLSALELIVQAIDNYARIRLSHPDASAWTAAAHCTQLATMLLRAATGPAIHALRHHGAAGKRFAEALLEDYDGPVARMVEINEQTEGLTPDQYSTLAHVYDLTRDLLCALGAEERVVVETLPGLPYC